jgi:TonB family protein
MSTSTEVWKNWEGRIVDEKFPLRQWLGGSEHSAAFLTERTGTGPHKAVIKLILAENRNDDAQLSRWAAAAKLSHPHLIRLFEHGRYAIDGTPFLYVVMEFADENLAEILPLRALAPAEASEMLRPTTEALDYLHHSGYAHGRIRPSNIMAVDNQLRISADGLRKVGERGNVRVPSAYDAPEIATLGLTPAADIWSLGLALVAVITQNEPKLTNGDRGQVAVPATIAQPFREIARQCLQVDPQRRCTAADILSQLQTQNRMAEVPASSTIVDPTPPKERSKKRFVIPVVIAALILIAWVGSKWMVHQPAIPAAETRTATAPPPAETPAPQSPAPVSENISGNHKPAPRGLARGSVLQQILPDVSRGAQNTITGHVKVSVQVSVDASGNVSQAQFASAGPSKYFADRALTAARGWKFTPPKADGQAVASEWILRFQFGRASTQVFPAEIKP